MSETPQIDRTGFHYGYVVAAGSAVILMIAWGAYYSYGIFFKPLLEEFGWTRAMTSGAFSLGTILQGVVAIFVGRITDRVGARPMVICGGILAGVGYMLMWQINSIWQLYIFYGVLTGLGMGSYFVPLVSNTAHWFQARRGLITGFVVAGIGLGAVIVPPLASRLIDTYDWRTSFVILGAAVLLSSVLVGMLIRPGTAKDKSPGGQGAPSRPAPALPGISFAAALRTRQLWMTCGLFSCLGFSLFSTIVHIAPHTTDIGFTAADGASVIAVIGIASILGKIGMGYFADRVGSRPGWIFSFVVMAAVMFWMIWATDLWALYLFAAFFGVAYGGMVANESPVVAELFGLRAHGVILGTASFAFTVGASLGPLLAGFIYDVTLSYRIAFMVIGGVAMLGILTALLLRPIQATRQNIYIGGSENRK